MYLLSTFNKKVIGWGDILCFMYVFVMPVLCFKLGVAVATSDANSNGYSVQVLLAPYTVFFRLDEVKTCKQKNGNSFYIEVVVKNVLPTLTLNFFYYLLLPRGHPVLDTRPDANHYITI